MDIGVQMKFRAFTTQFVTATILISSVIAAVADDRQDATKIAHVTETLNFDNNGQITGKDVVKDSRIDVTEQVSERYVGDSANNMRLVARTTTTRNTLGNVVTTVEGLPTPQSTDMIIISVTTATNDGLGGSVTTTEDIGPKGILEITRRVTVKKIDDKTVTMVETLDKYRNLIVTSQTIVR
jgi:hypothetical protein